MELWVAITVAAVILQTVRTGLQKHLKTELTTSAITFVRFLFGLPIAAIYLAGLIWISDEAVPPLTASFVGLTFVAGIGQIVGTFLLVYLVFLPQFRGRHHLHQDRSGADRLVRPDFLRRSAEHCRGIGGRHQRGRRDDDLGCARAGHAARVHDRMDRPHRGDRTDIRRGIRRRRGQHPGRQPVAWVGWLPVAGGADADLGDRDSGRRDGDLYGLARARPACGDVPQF